MATSYIGCRICPRPKLDSSLNKGVWINAPSRRLVNENSYYSVNICKLGLCGGEVCESQQRITSGSRGKLASNNLQEKILLFFFPSSATPRPRSNAIILTKRPDMQMEYPVLLGNAVTAVVMHCNPIVGLSNAGWVLKESSQGPNQ